ncbi:hypothetical protein [Nodularia spumigena]|uniref:hypothetical protein n=1 Tax=Nodularia spumigena TaxID=70799 RepID=UPI002330A068|nr:hypothetical protein [Nodularia spumigena]MDB9318535.1 hypothetical protein [Nodularia spumigena CS-590/01A]MDB9323375.1 hypothetical protein [Nodularia spumigena CS-591/07A]MDB9327802.1 hypothetical protein [Nodularia spumigena CS-590/02]MDB9331808.1 hypothetical protein [Nodularia spumigena CS-591/04]MDB9333480.1 hypothetical protein [Nodularia spumigena CS-590/01]
MNTGNYQLAQFDYSLALQPETKLKFANLLTYQALNLAFYLVETAQFLDDQAATWRRKVKYSHEKLLSITLENVDAGFFRPHWLESWRNIFIQLDMLTLTLQGEFTFKFRNAPTQGIKSFWWKLPLPT